MRVNEYLSCCIETVSTGKFTIVNTVYKKPFIFDISDKNLLKQFKGYYDFKDKDIEYYEFKLSYDEFREIVLDLECNGKPNTFNLKLFKEVLKEVEKIKDLSKDIFLELNLNFTYNYGI